VVFSYAVVPLHQLPPLQFLLLFYRTTTTVVCTNAFLDFGHWSQPTACLGLPARPLIRRSTFQTLPSAFYAASIACIDSVVQYSSTVVHLVEKISSAGAFEVLGLAWLLCPWLQVRLQ
jgi:hypothetical protein